MDWNKNGKQPNMLPSSLRKIGWRAFGRCINLEGIGLNEGLLSIGDEAFIECRKIEEIIIPSTLEELGKRVFSGCEALRAIIIKGNRFAVSSETFEGIPASTQFYVFSEDVKQKLIAAGIESVRIHLEENQDALS